MRILSPDLEGWILDYIRSTAVLEGRNVEVDAKFPSEWRVPMERPLIVVREDPARRTSLATFEAGAGISVCTSTRSDTRALSRWLHGVLTDDEIVEASGSPVAAVNHADCASPISVPDEHPVFVQYFTVSYSTVGDWN